MIKVTKTEYGTVYTINRVTGSGGTHTPNSIPKKEWVGLTDEEIKNSMRGHNTQVEFARAIEAKLKEKNSD